MAHDELYEESLIQRLNEVERTREWLECELREVRNRLQRKRSQQRDVIDWSGDMPKFNNLGEWVKMSAPHMPMMNNQGLLSCPFCGCDEVGIAIDEDGWEYIECGDCYCRTDASPFHNRELMTKSWNTRNGHPYAADDFNQAAEERDYGL